MGLDVALLSAMVLAVGAALALTGCEPEGGDDFPPHLPADDDAGDDDASGDDDTGDDDTGDDDAGDDDDEVGYPDFITANEDFFETHISSVPDIDPDTFVLSVSGLLDQSAELTLAELDLLPRTTVPQTLECIGNGVGGSAVSTANWEGFSLWDLLLSLGIHEDAAAIRYEGADGYWASHTLDEVRDGGVIGALTMNGEPIPPRHGYPLRFVYPGFYGVKNPGWVTAIEVVDAQEPDFWEMVGWDCSPPMHVDSRFFFPGSGAAMETGVPFDVGGAAWGGTRIDGIEISPDDGETWLPTEIVQGGEQDHVWVFWRATLTLLAEGEVKLRIRATDTAGNVQPEIDNDPFDGSNGWAGRTIYVLPPS